MLLCLTDISAGMSYLHSIGLLHSDLKGANVLLKSCAVTSSDPRGFLCKVRCLVVHEAALPKVLSIGQSFLQVAPRRRSSLQAAVSA